MSHPPHRPDLVGHAAAPLRAGRAADALCALAALVGLVGYGVAVGAGASLGSPVLFALLAAAVAVVSLTPGQPGRIWLVVVLAVTGFFDALAAWAALPSATWSATTIMLLIAAQAVLAVVALLYEVHAPEAAAGPGATQYEAYAEMLRAYHAYADRYRDVGPPLAAPAANAHAHAVVVDRARRTHDQPSEMGWLDRYAGYGDDRVPVAPAPTSAPPPGTGSAAPNAGHGDGHRSARVSAIEVDPPAGTGMATGGS